MHRFLRYFLRNVAITFLLFPLTPVSVVSAEDTPTFGVLLPLSGPFANLGEDCRRGMVAAQGLYLEKNKVEGRPVRFLVEDTQADPKLSLSAFQQMIGRGDVLAVLIPRSPVGMALNPASLKLKMPLLGAVGHPQFVPQNPYAFQFWSSTQTEAKMLSNYMLSRGQKKIAMITLEDDWTLAISDDFRQAHKQASGLIVYTETIMAGDLDLNTLVSKTRSASPDAIFVNVGVAQGGVIVKRFREQGLEQPIYSNFWAAKQEAIASGGRAMEGVQFVEMSLQRPRLRAELSRLFKDESASAMTLACHSIIATLLQTIRENPDIETAEDMQRALVNVKSVKLLDGDVPLEDRRALFPLSMKRISGGGIAIENVP